MAVPALVPIVTGISTAFQMVSAIKQGNAQEDASALQAQQAEENAAISLQQAAEDERIFRVGARKQLGSMRANAAASGFQIAGSIEHSISESTAMAEEDALRIRYGGELRAKGYKDEAQNARRRGEAYSTGSKLSAAGYLLGGAGKMTDYLSYGGQKSNYLSVKDPGSYSRYAGQGSRVLPFYN